MIKIRKPIWLRDLIFGIKNIVYWFPVIWKDRHWDEWYIIKILNHKLKITHKRQRWGEIFYGGELAENYLRIAVFLSGEYLNFDLPDERRDKALKTLCSVIAKRSGYWWD